MATARGTNAVTVRIGYFISRRHDFILDVDYAPWHILFTKSENKMNATATTRRRHIATLDTREQERIDGKGWRGIAGTGESLPCHCCGKAHEVHAIIAVEQQGGEIGRWVWSRVATLNYGVSCARKITTVHSETFSRDYDRVWFDKMMTLARAA